MIGQRIRCLREDLKLSRREFGEKIGVSGDVVNNWERERVKIPEITVKMICSAFSVRESWLRTGEGGMHNDSINPEYDLIEKLIEQYGLGSAGTALLRAVARVFSELDEETASRIVDDAIAELQSSVAARAVVVADPSSRAVSDPQSPADQESSSSLTGSVVG